MSVKNYIKSTPFYFFDLVSNSRLCFAAAAVFAFLLCAANAFPAAAEPVATIGSMSGDFEHKPAGTDKYDAVKRVDAASMKLYDRDALRTPESVSGTIETVCGAKIEMKEKTEIELGVLSVRIKRGDTWINYKRPSKGVTGDNFRVLTPAGTIGIKGTAFRTLVAESGEVGIFVSEGVISFTNGAGDVKTVEAGFGLTVGADGKSGAPVKIEGSDETGSLTPNGEQGVGKAGESGLEKGFENDENSHKNGTDEGAETKKPVQIEDGKDVNTEANPFE